MFPIVFLVPLQPAFSDLISGLAFAVAVLGSMSSLFAPKALLLWQGADLDAQFRIVMPAKTKKGISSEKLDATNLQSSLQWDEYPDIEAIQSLQSNKIPREEKKVICREQIEKLQYFLIKLENKNIFGDGASDKTTNSQPTRNSFLNNSTVAPKYSILVSPQKDTPDTCLENKMYNNVIQKLEESPEGSLDGSVRDSVRIKKGHSDERYRDFLCNAGEATL